MNTSTVSTAQLRRWPEQRDARIPAWIYSDPDLFKREMEVFYEGSTWNFVGLACEIAEPGAFKRSWIGTRPVLMVRDEDGTINVVENRCAHRGSMLCWKNNGVVKDFTCPYHHWSYDLKGNLLGLPFLRGAMGKGGMPRDFAKGEHGLRKLRVEERKGLVWATFDESAPDLEAYLGDEIAALIDRATGNGRLKLLGYNRQLLPCNWKLYVENSRDPYHATLLHSFFLTFGLLRADTAFKAVPTLGGRHAIMASTYSAATASEKNEVTQQLASLKSDFSLQDMDMVRPVDEFGDSSMINFSVLPSVFFQQHGNSLAIRHVIPKSESQTELSWTHYGFEDDDETMQSRRIKQANLMGPAGYVAVDDSEVLALMQPVAQSAPDSVQAVEMGGRDYAPQETMLTETLIRSFYHYYREKMGL
ncbi:Rieske 2Fe-2S domain-containing protein [Paraburkholderia sp. Ac-20336]|uniref:aromatic ring-hydroxylating oxygenase subunit alpha n=1 Tax=unclassified Paraburkholderia TaxID=2615204 RepID=UPI00197DA049|nr:MULTISPECIES: SRPBCC family protein [unclassified Paraburkholderia]MBN3801496.1 Rieske 2Fe-2S domain-containing protein [Paraburkholderia sp. Ac-20336]MBN3846047.1 Rieske 2Fe-2S domain-containing protein [Paraburkholderia sp. Ac-20342]